MNKIDVKKPLTVTMKFFYYDKNSAEKYCTLEQTKTFRISDKLSKFFAIEENCENFRNKYKFSKIVLPKESEKNYNKSEIAEELMNIESEIVDFANETINNLKKQYLFVSVGRAHTILDEKKYNKNTEKSIED